MRPGAEAARAYWDSLDAGEPELFGVSPMGGAGVLEARYRHHCELARLRRIVGFGAGDDVLELGSGNARWALSLAPRVGRYTAVDFSAAAMELARRRVAAARLANVDLVQKNIAEFVPDRPYDVVYFSGVTQYLSDAELAAALSNVRPWLRPGGRVVDRSTVGLKGRDVNDTGGYFSIYRTVAELEASFAGHGLRLLRRVRSYRPLRIPASLKRDRVLRLAAALAELTRPLSYHALHAATALADTIKPVPFEGGLHSHDFLVFGCET